MHYKTIVLELLQQNPTIYNQLRTKRILMPSLDLYAKELKTSHEAWTHCLHQAMPGREQSQIASEALEIALWEMETFLHFEYSPDESEELYVEAILTLLRAQAHHT